MIANILGILTAGGAILALLDILLTDRIKGWLSRIVTVVWSYLDDLRALSLVDWLNNPRAKTWLGVTIGLFLLTIETMGAGAVGFIKEELTLRAIIVMLVTVGVVPIVLISFVALPSGRYYWLKVLSVLLCTAGLFAVVAPSVIMYVGVIVVIVVIPVVVVSRPIFGGLLRFSSGRYSLLKMCAILACLLPILLFCVGFIPRLFYITVKQF
jgi:hypothetical protein